MVRVEAYSRLHFGLLNPFPVSPGERRFGGVGLMVREPSLRLTVCAAASWSAEGPAADRALSFAQRFAALAPPERVRPARLVVETSPPSHVGLGSGTQLGLAVAGALAGLWGLGATSPPALGARLGRGRRSAVGMHGFEQGGFLVEAGRREEDSASPVVTRQEFPGSWSVLLVIPAATAGLHGDAEIQAFERLKHARRDESRTDRLCRLVLLGMLPALAEHDLLAFGEALYEFNRLVGECFAPVQGGIYSSQAVEAVVGLLRAQGVAGVAQSSWGPAVAAVTDDAERAAALAGKLRERFSLTPGQVIVTRGCNHGAIVQSA